MDVSRWLTSHQYAGMTAIVAVRAVTRLFNWAARQGILRTSPIAGVERPAAVPRECYVTAEQWERVLSVVKLLDLLELTAAVVTLDALHCQTETAAAIRRKGRTTS